MSLQNNLKKTIAYGKRNGYKAAFIAVAERTLQSRQEAYVFTPPSTETLEAQRKALAELTADLSWKLRRLEKPLLFSILVPAFETEPAYLCALIQSLQAQTYPYWELVLADASKSDKVAFAVKAFAGDEARIRYVRLDENRGISENSNAGLLHVRGDYVGLLDHDDFLTPDALFEMASSIRNCSEGLPWLLYSDEDKCDGEGINFYEPHFKEDFNLDLLLSNNYICHFAVLKREILQTLQFRKEYDGAQDYDLFLRLTKKAMEEGGGAGQVGQALIRHIPKVLYHWRCHEASTAQNPQSKTYAYEAGLKALQDFAATQFPGKVTARHLTHLGFYGLSYEDDFWESRPDVGLVGGKILKKKRIAGGRFSPEGEVYYKGLPAAFGGYLHRAKLSQDAYAVDLRCCKARKECIPLLEDVLGCAWQTLPGTEIFDVTCLPADADKKALALACGLALQAAGYLIFWDPDWVMKG